MRTRQVGDTGIAVSEVGFGCGGNAGLMVGGDPAARASVVGHALARGITYFDLAPDYGDGLAETHLGPLVAPRRPEVVLTSKVEIRRSDLPHIADHIERSVDESLERLGTGRLDFLQIHNGPAEHPPILEGRGYRTLWIKDYLRPGGVLEGVERVLSRGKARHAGFISRGDDRAPVESLLSTGLFKLVNLPYSLLNPTPGTDAFSGAFSPDHHGLIEKARAAGTGIAVYSPLAGGLLTDTLLDTGRTHPAARGKDTATLSASGKLAAARRFQQIARAAGLPLTHLAYRFALSHPGVTTVLGGFSGIEHVEDMAQASAAGPLPADLMAAIEAVWREIAKTESG